MPPAYAVYILTNLTRSVLYIGVTCDLPRRLEAHRSGIAPGFTQKYHIHFLVHAEAFQDYWDACIRERELKGWRRSKKEALINRRNPEWNDLTEVACGSV